MAGAGPSLVEIPAWRVDLLFFVLLLATLALTKGDEALVHYLANRKKIGYLHIYEAVKEELLLVGVISLVLSGVQKPLEKICVSTPRIDEVFSSFLKHSENFGHYPASSYYPPPSSEYGYPPAPEEGQGQPARRSLLEAALLRWRVLLAAKDDNGDQSPCAEGSTQLFPASALHALHIMLFLVAVTQIIYSCLVLALCLWKVSRWRKHEARAQMEPGLLHHLDTLHQGNSCTAKYRQFKQQAMQKLSKEARRDYVRHFSATSALMFASVDAEQYIVMRHIFLQQLGLDASFDFLDFVKESMETEFASLVGVNSYMWFILFLWIVCPPETYISIIVPLLHLLLALVIGFKLSSVMLIFHSRVKQEWVNSGDRRVERAKSVRRTDPADLDSLTNLRRQRGKTAQTEVEISGRSDPEGGSEVEESEETGCGTPLYSETEGETGPEELARRCTELALAISNTEAIPIAKAERISVVWRYSSFKPTQPNPNQDCEQEPEKQPHESESEEAPATHGSRDATKLKKRFFGGGQKAMGANWIERKYHKASTDSSELFWRRQPELLLHLMQMVYFGMSIQLSMTLFTAWMVRSNAISSWFPPPVTPPMVPPQGLPSGYLLPIFKPPAELYNPDTTVFAGTIVFEVCTNLFILLWCALIVLPEYALASTVGSHCPSSVLLYAQRNSLQPKLAKALEAVAKLNRMQEVFLRHAVQAAAELPSLSQHNSGPSKYDVAAKMADSTAPSESRVEQPDAADVEQLLDVIIDAQLDANISKGGQSGYHNPSSAVQMKLMGAVYDAQLKRLRDQHLGDPRLHVSNSATWHAAPSSSRPESQSLSSVMKLFNAAEGAEGSTSSGVATPEAGGSCAAGPSRVAEKQQLLMQIVGIQENLKAAQAKQQKGKIQEKEPPRGFSLMRHSMTASINLDKPTTAPPVGFSLSRHSMTPAVNLQKQKPPPPLQPRPRSKPSKRSAPQRPTGPRLNSTSATPRLETVHDNLSPELAFHPPPSESPDQGEANNPGLSSQRSVQEEAANSNVSLQGTRLHGLSI